MGEEIIKLMSKTVLFPTCVQLRIASSFPWTSVVGVGSLRSGPSAFPVPLNQADIHELLHWHGFFGISVTVFTNVTHLWVVTPLGHHCNGS